MSTARPAPVVVDGIFNFRDVGGLPAGGGTTRTGVLFRSANLARVTDAGRAALTGLGLRHIIDLRADDEVAHEPSLLEGMAIETTRVPLLLGSAQSFFLRNLTLAQMNRMLVEQMAEQLVAVVRGVITHQPVLVHCTVGKDRTGLTVALALAAAGVDRDAVIADYALTASQLPERRNKAVLAWLAAQHPHATNIVELATLSPAPVMQQVLAGLDEQYGSPADYLRASGLGDDEIRELRQVLVTTD